MHKCNITLTYILELCTPEYTDLKYRQNTKFNRNSCSLFGFKPVIPPVIWFGVFFNNLNMNCSLYESSIFFHYRLIYTKILISLLQWNQWRTYHFQIFLMLFSFLILTSDSSKHSLLTGNDPPPHAHYKQGLQISTAQLHVSIFLDSVKLAVMEHGNLG